MNTTLKFLMMTAITCGISSTVYAVAAGPYIGFQAGQTNTNNIPRNIQTGSTPPTVFSKPTTNTGVGARAFVGYNFNEYAALEGGFTHYAPTTYPNVTSGCGNPQIHENGFDFVGKGILPFFSSGFSLFAKAGFAVVRATLSGSLMPDASPTCGSQHSTNYVRPVYGIGAGYDFNENWVGDISWSRVAKGGGFQNADFIALGISYHWVDKYCGQFLC